MASESKPDERREKITALLNAALPEFASAGLQGARVDAIARAAGINKRLLYHYVGDKEALFTATLNLAFDRILDSPEALHSAEWRLICHGCAVGRTSRLAELEALNRPIGAARAAPALGIRLLAALMPDLADRLLGNETGDDPGRYQAVRRTLRNLSRVGPKPRLKLRPALKTGTSSGR